MSKENVELVRRAWEIIAKGRVDEPMPDAALDFFAEDCVMEDFPELPDRGVYKGRSGVREIEQHFQEIWGAFEQDPLEFIDAGQDTVVVVVRMRGRGTSSGAPLDAQAVWVMEVRDGLLARCRAFTTKDQALEVAGLAP